MSGSSLHVAGTIRCDTRGRLWQVVLLVTALLCNGSLFAQQSEGPTKQAFAEEREKLAERNRLWDEAQALAEKGQIKQALAVARRMLTIERKHLGDISHEVAASLEWIADHEEQLEDFEAAVATREQVLDVRAKLHGTKDWRVTDSRVALERTRLLDRLSPEERSQLTEAQKLDDRLFELYQRGEYRLAIEPAEKALQIRTRILTEEHVDSARAINYLALLYYSIGDNVRAKPLFDKALRIRKKLLGESHPDTAGVLNNLGLLYDRLGNFAAAEQALVEALKIKKEVHGDDHPDTATSLNSLGYLYERMSDYARAEPMYVKALEIHKREYGAEDTRTALSLNNLGALYRAMGDYERAEPLCVAALEMRRKLLGEEHSDTAISRNNLALLYQNKGVYARAEPLFVKALEVNRQLHGDEHEYTALSLHNLGALYQMTGDFAQAEPLCAKALEIRQSLLGDEHPDTAVSRNNLAVLYQNMGDFDRAEPLYQKALDINRKIHGEDHPHTALCLNNLAPLYELMGQFDRAELLSRQALEIYQRHLQRTFDVQSERQQLAFSKTFRVDIDFYLSVAPHAGVDAATMYEPVLLWKGMIYSRRAQWQRLRRDAPKNLAGLFDEFQSLGVRLATLSSATPDPTNRDIWLRQIEELTVARERLEIELARQSVAFRQERKSANCTPQQLQQALPASVGLIDFLEYTHFSPAKERKEGFRAERRLLAFIVRQDRDVVRVDLGAVDALRDAAEAWRRSILAGGGRSGNQPAAGELPPQQFLREQIWLPLEEHLQGAETVLLSPDGLVSRIPLAALPGKMPGTYLLHEMSLAVIPVPQELPRLLESRPATATPDAPSMLLVGDVDFEADPGRVAIAKAAFKPLPGTGREVEVIGRLYQDRFAADKPQELRGPAATEAAFRAHAPRHRFVHVATHGFFADEATPSALDNEDIEPARPSMFIDEGQVRALHPGLLSGLALAGANRSRSIVSIDAKVAEGDQPEDDGILTALEVAGLDFSGVELVVLSACETSLGRVVEGEGVLGLQRAFQSSGALTCVTSLWKVEDRATQVFMEEFYRQLWTVKQDKLTALRKAQLAMLERYDRVQKIIVPRGADVPHDPDAYATNSPYFWAAFILSGDWR